MTDPTPAEWQTVIDGLPHTLFMSDLVFLADIEGDERIEAVKDLFLESTSDDIVPLSFLGIDYQTQTPGVVLIPVSLKILKDLIAEAEGK